MTYFDSRYDASILNINLMIVKDNSAIIDENRQLVIHTKTTRNINRISQNATQKLDFEQYKPYEKRDVNLGALLGFLIILN